MYGAKAVVMAVILLTCENGLQIIFGALQDAVTCASTRDQALTVSQSASALLSSVRQCYASPATTGNPGLLCVGKYREHMRRSLGLKIC